MGRLWHMCVCGSPHIWLRSGSSHHGLLHTPASAARFPAALTVSHRLGAPVGRQRHIHAPASPRIFKESTPLTELSEHSELRGETGEAGCDRRTNERGWRLREEGRAFRGEEARSLRADAAQASCTVFHPPKLFFPFGRCLNHITVCGLCEAADQRGTDEKTAAMKPGTCTEPSNKPTWWKGRTRCRTRAINSQPECRRQRRGGRQVAACWPACLDPDNSTSPPHPPTPTPEAQV